MKNQLIFLSLFFVLPFFVSAQKDSTLKHPHGFRNNVKISPFVWALAEAEFERAINRRFSWNLDGTYVYDASFISVYNEPLLSLKEYVRFYPFHRKEKYIYNKGFYFLAGLYQFYEFAKSPHTAYDPVLDRYYSMNQGGVSGTWKNMGFFVFGGLGYQFIILKRILIDLYAFAGPKLWQINYVSHVPGKKIHHRDFRYTGDLSIKFGFAF